MDMDYLHENERKRKYNLFLFIVTREYMYNLRTFIFFLNEKRLFPISYYMSYLEGNIFITSNESTKIF